MSVNSCHAYNGAKAVAQGSHKYQVVRSLALQLVETCPPSRRNIHIKTPQKNLSNLYSALSISLSALQPTINMEEILNGSLPALPVEEPPLYIGRITPIAFEVCWILEIAVLSQD